MKKIIFFLVVIAFCIFPFRVKGYENDLDFNAKGEISLSIIGPDTKQPIIGLGTNVYYIGTIDKHNNNIMFTLTKPFENSGISFENINGGTTLDIAKKLKSYTDKEKISSYTIRTDEKGIASLKFCRLGLYLMVPNSMMKNSLYKDINPFIVSVPYTSSSGSSWIYKVQATPKIEIKAKTPNKPSNAEDHDPKLPQTGLLKWPIPILVILGVLVFFIGWAKVFLNKKYKV